MLIQSSLPYKLQEFMCKSKYMSTDTFGTPKYNPLNIKIIRLKKYDEQNTSDSHFETVKRLAVTGSPVGSKMQSVSISIFLVA